MAIPKKGSQLTSVAPDPASDSLYVIREVGASKSSVKTPVSSFATAAQGTKADTALQDEEAFYQLNTVEKFPGKLRPGYVAAYNGAGATSPAFYSIGLAYSSDGDSWVRDARNPVITVGASGTWDQNHAKDPWLVIQEDAWYMFYAGYRTSTNKYQIGVAISRDHGDTWVKSASNPVIPNGAAGTVHENRAIFPIVKYEPDDVVGKRWKCWFSARDAANDETLAYAYAENPEGPWTVYGRVLDLGAAGEWDDGILQSGGDVLKFGSTYYWFYGGNHDYTGERSANTTRWQGGLCTFTNPESTYTRQGKILSSLTARRQDLTSDVAADTNTIPVADSSVFQEGEFVLVGDTSAQPRLTKITSIPSATSLVLRDNVDADLAVSRSASVRSVHYWSMEPRSVFRENGRWTMAVTAFQQVNDLSSSYLRELSVWAYNENEIPTGEWTVDVDRGVMVEFDLTSWDKNSAENACVVPMRGRQNWRAPGLFDTTPTSIIAKTRRFIARAKALFIASGVVTTAIGSNALVGKGTRFLKHMVEGDRVTVGAETVTVIAIASDLAATVYPPFTAVNTLAAYTVLPAVMRGDDSSGVPKFVVQDNGRVGVAGIIGAEYPLDVAGLLQLLAGTQKFRPGGTIYQESPHIANAADTVAVTTTPYSLPAGTMANDGDELEILGLMLFSAAGSTKNYRVSVGYSSFNSGSNTFTGGLPVVSNGSATGSITAEVTARIKRTSATTADYFSITQFSSGSAQATQFVQGAAITWANAQNIMMSVADGTGNAAAATIEWFKVKYDPR